MSSSTSSDRGRREAITPLDYATIETPIGMIEFACANDALVAMEFADVHGRLALFVRRRFGDGVTLRRARDPLGVGRRLARYFDGDVAAIDAIRSDGGGTSFQRQVWTALRTIAAGTTSTYGALASALGRPAAMRAVGHANGANPIAIVVPCHRLIGASGQLVGYAGGVERKRWLLAHERAHAR